MDSWESPEVEQDDRDGHHEQDNPSFEISFQQFELLPETVHHIVDPAHRFVDVVDRRLDLLKSLSVVVVDR